MLSRRPVVIMQMPEYLDSREAMALMQDVEPLIESDYPQIVFDCSGVRYLDGAGGNMILHCLQAAMQHNGDLKLAALSPEPESKAVMELMREASTLQAFATTAEAVRSFNPAPNEGFEKRASSSIDLLSDAKPVRRAS